VYAVLQLAVERDLRDLRLDVHLHRHHVQALDHVADRLPRARGGAHQQGVGLVDSGHPDAVALDLEGHAAVAALARIQAQRTVAEAAARRPAHAAVHAAGERVARIVEATLALAARAARTDRERIRARRQRDVAVTTGPAARAAAAAAEDFGQAVGQVLGLDVLQLVREQLHPGARAVDALQPLLDLRSEEHTSELQSRENL